MATQSKTAYEGATKPDNLGKVRDVPVPVMYTVTYKFSVSSSSNLSMPYAVAINGKVPSDFKKKPGRVSGSNGAITIKASTGDTISLYLNSDAHPDHRNNPVYAIKVSDKNLLIKITERSGKHKDGDTPVLQSSTATLDTYAAPLTGDIWMKVSHKYTPAQVPALLPEGTSAAVQTAVFSIYSGLASAKLTIATPATADKPAGALSVEFQDADNPRNNITAFNLLTDGLPRVHPAGFAALFSAAIDKGISALVMTSCWRPMLGSIAHRAGLGLDVGYVGKVKMNRQELRANARTGVGNRNDQDNVTDEEVKVFKDFETAIVDSKKAQDRVKAATEALRRAKNSGQGITEAEQEVQASDKASKAASRQKQDLERDWDEARNKGEPSTTKEFRISLLSCDCVKQLFDPWYLYKDARSGAPGQPNMQLGASTSLERLHSHHLHITVEEPKIL